MPKAPGLTRKGSAYYYRRRVPDDVRGALGKGEIWIALGTTIYKQACDAARRVAAEVDRQIAAARAGKPVPTIEAKAAIGDAVLQRVAMRHLHELEALTVGAPDLEDPAELEAELVRLLEGGAAAPHLLSSAQRAAKKNGVKLPEPATDAAGELRAPAPLIRLVDLVRRAETEHLRRRLDRLEGEGGDAAHDPLFADVSAIRPPPPAARTDNTRRNSGPVP